MTRTLIRVAMLALALLVMTVPAADAQDKTGWNMRLNATWTIPDERTVNEAVPGYQVETNTAETFGLALSGEFRFSPRLGLELGAQAGYDASVKYTVRDVMTGEIVGDDLDPHPGDEMRFTLVDLALNIYLSSGAGELYVGPVIGFLTFSDTHVRAGSEDPVFIIENDGDFAYGAVVGFDAGAADSPWFFTSSIKYIVSSYDASISSPIAPPFDFGTTEVDFDSWIFRLGLGYRF